MIGHSTNKSNRPFSTDGLMSDTAKAMLLLSLHSPEANSPRPARCK